MTTTATPQPAQDAAPAANGMAPCAIVIFGANGDLTKRKLIPALVNLSSGNLLPSSFATVGVVRDETSHQVYRDRVGKELPQFATNPVDPALWAELAKRTYCAYGDLRDPATYARLKDLLAQLDRDHGTDGNAVFYLSTPPQLILDIVNQLAAAGLTKEESGHFRRIVIEKPFGTDLDSARQLNIDIDRAVSEKQIFRIDHYLGKETVQNLMVFRFANGIFEPMWNRNYIDNVQITVAETLGVESRGGYYDTAGALRDMVPNHMLQLLSLIAMEPPVSFEAEAVRDEKAKALRAITILEPEDVLTRTVRGQYGEGQSSKEKMPAYRSEVKVAPKSETETYVAMRLTIDNWRWAGVPFYLRTGKRLSKRVTEIAIQFRRAPHMLFRDTAVGRLSPNLLIVSIQPKEGISLRFAAKVPGPGVQMRDVDMEFKYADFFGQKPNTGYETLLHDVMVGDATLFQRADTVEQGWRVVQPLLDVWKALHPRAFPNYAAGTSGPKEADEMLARDGRAWRKIDS